MVLRHHRKVQLKDYLVFLSVYQTLRRKGMSLLRFLLSGETDIEKFVSSYRRP